MMPCCEISDCAQMSKTIIAVRHFGLGGRESLETAVKYTILAIWETRVSQAVNTLCLVSMKKPNQAWCGIYFM